LATRIADLFVELGLEDQDFINGLKRAEGGARRFARNAARVTAAAGAAFAAAGAAMGVVVKRAVETGDEIAKTARRIGIGAESFQELEFAAQQSGVAMQDLRTALTALIRRQGEAVSGNKEFAKGFEQLGIPINELRRLGPDELLNRIADGLQRLPNQAARIAALDRVMSETGRRIINLFGGGSEALERFRAQARDLGLVIGGDLLSGAESLSDQFNILSQRVSKTFTRAVLENAGEITEVVARFGAALPDILQNVVDLSRGVGEFAKSLGLIERSPAEKRARDLAEEMSRLGTEVAAIEGRLGTFRKLLARVLFTDGAARAERLKQVLAEMAEEVSRLGFTVTQNADGSFNLFEQRQSTLRRSVEDTTSALQNQQDAVEDLGGPMRQLEDVFRRGRQTFEATRTPIEQFRARLAELREEVNANAISSDTFERGVKQASERLRDAQAATEDLSDASRLSEFAFRNFADAAARGLEDAIIQARSLSDIMQGLLQDIARLAIRRFITGPIFSSLLPGRAGGGSLQPNVPTIVGERGPEIVTANRPATVLNNADSRGLGGGSTVSQTFNFPVAFPAQLEAFVRNVAGPAGRDAALQVANAQRGRV